jgi:hypothetical protein
MVTADQRAKEIAPWRQFAAASINLRDGTEDHTEFIGTQNRMTFLRIVIPLYLFV